MFALWWNIKAPYLWLQKLAAIFHLSDVRVTVDQKLFHFNLWEKEFSLAHFISASFNRIIFTPPLFFTWQKWNDMLFTGSDRKFFLFFFFMSDWAESKNNAFGLLAYIFPNKKTQKDKMRCQNKIVPNLQWVKNAKLSWLHLYWKLAGNAWWCITQKRKCAPPVRFLIDFEGFQKHAGHWLVLKKIIKQNRRFGVFDKWPWQTQG